MATAKKKSNRSSRPKAHRPARPAATPVKVQNLRIIQEDDEHGTPNIDLEHGDPAYAKQDRARLEAFHRDEWNMTGVYAVVDLIVDGTTQEIRTPGVWGIESDSERNYIRETGAEQYGELVGLLRKLGVRTPPPLRSAKWLREP